MEFTPIFAGLPILALHIAAAGAIFCSALIGYTYVTPHSELKLLLEGNTAAGISLTGVIFGLALPLQACVTTSLHVNELAVTGVLAALVQLILFVIMARLIPDLSGRIENGDIGVALPLAATEVVAGMFLAGAVHG